MAEYPIDIVVLWLDDSDPVWQKDFSKYSQSKEKHLYRDWGWMRYWFRGVEKNVPWVNKIHFITYGHLPKWLDTSHPKLNIVRHSDYIPQEYLPTFSSHPIELNLHRIPELSEHFIFCNDDFFFVGKMEKNDYFQNGMPCDWLQCCPITQSRSKSFHHILLNNTMALNRHFTPQESAAKNPEKWFASSYSQDIIDDNHAALQWNRFIGLKYDHMPIPLLKSKMEELWNAEPVLLDEVCRHKIRNIEMDVNIFLCRFWNLAQGNFVPYLRKSGVYCKVSAKPDEIIQALQAENGVACLNDVDEEVNFEERKTFIASRFETLFPEKSSFEL